MNTIKQWLSLPIALVLFATCLYWLWQASRYDKKMVEGYNRQEPHLPTKKTIHKAVAIERHLNETITQLRENNAPLSEIIDRLNRI